MEMNINISDPKTGKTYKRVLKDDDCKPLLGKKIGQTIKGELLSLEGYELRLAGGSDDCGFPMRHDVSGTARRKVLIAGGVGIRSKRRGLRRRKTVAGNTVSTKTAQINLLVVKKGKGHIDPSEEKSEKPEGGDKADDKVETAVGKSADKGDSKPEDDAKSADVDKAKSAESSKDKPEADKKVDAKADKPKKDADDSKKKVESEKSDAESKSADKSDGKGK